MYLGNKAAILFTCIKYRQLIFRFLTVDRFILSVSFLLIVP
jgi:hypothetical protein